MSVYKPKGSKEYVYDFWYRGDRFRGTTKATTKREAEAFQKRLKDQKKAAADKADSTKAAFRGNGVLTLGAATARWWNEVGKHHANSDTSWKDLERMVDWFGNDRDMGDILDADIAQWVASRRGETIKGALTLKDKSPAPLVKPSTVNRSTVDSLRKIFGRARLTWKVRYDSEPDWKTHRLPEPGEQPAELSFTDQERVHTALPDGYRDAVAFALASGLRLENVILEWSQVDWEGGRIKVTQKGGRTHSLPMSRDMRAILSSCKGRDEKWVFTYALRRRSKTRRILGERYPVTYYGLQIAWRRVVAKLKIDLTFHGLRHTTGTRIMRQTGNIKAAQKVLGHADLATTSKFYAHATEDDVRKALDETPLASPRIETAEEKNDKKGKTL